MAVSCGIAAILLTIVFWKRLRLVTVSLPEKIVFVIWFI